MAQVHIADIIFVCNGRILLVQQRKPKAYGSWSLPGGHVEDGETVQQAISREVFEELGLALPDVDSLANNLHHENSDENELNVTTFYKACCPLEIKIQDEELIGFGWFSLKELQIFTGRLRSPWILPLAGRLLKD
ncbi:MAG TPA: NUDIX hydrolase [Patescibacteria group bacterium]|nr:NUDIX hydrolase [Patescibacteria group bacterium]